jgi:hypothetical protein
MLDDESANRYRMMQRYLGWSDEDAHVRGARPLVAHADTLIVDFYAEIRRHPEAMKVITGGSEQMVRLRGRCGLADGTARGPYDDAYGPTLECGPSSR